RPGLRPCGRAGGSAPPPSARRSGGAPGRGRESLRAGLCNLAGHDRGQLVGGVRGGDRGDLRVVVGGRHLDDVRRDQVAGRQAAQDLQQFAGGHAARLGRAGAGGVRRVEAVDVDGDVQRAVADALAELVGDLVGAAPVDVGGGDDAEAHLLVVGEVLLAVQRAADADVGQGGGVEDALLYGPAERGAVGVLGAEVGVPGVQVRVEVEQ